MQELTQVEFMNALDGQAVAIAWHHSFSSYNKAAVDEVAHRWFINLDTLFEGIEAWCCYRATKANSHTFTVGRHISISTHGFRCYRAKSGWLFMLKQSACYIGGSQHHFVEAYLFAVNS